MFYGIFNFFTSGLRRRDEKCGRIDIRKIKQRCYSKYEIEYGNARKKILNKIFRHFQTEIGLEIFKQFISHELFVTDCVFVILWIR